MVNLTIDGIKISVPAGTTIIAAASVAGVEIPRFCYHEELSIAGNCRMCLVQVKNTPKPVASCAMPVNEGMVVDTTTDMTKKAREGVIEFLLKNHPLDCPVCDQAGECDLQDQTYAFGSDRGRYWDNKRAAHDNYNTGPLIKTNMTRCIHCTRCIRFGEEVAGVPDYGTTGRGEDTQVGTYIEKMFMSPLSANVIDLCPVGALTNKPYSYVARPWELKHHATYDINDVTCSPIDVHVMGNDILRILPRLGSTISPWISNRTRFSYDAVNFQRLDTPFITRGNKSHAITWEDAIEIAHKKIAKSHDTIFLVGTDTNIETLEHLTNMTPTPGQQFDLAYSPFISMSKPSFAGAEESSRAYKFDDIFASSAYAPSIFKDPAPVVVISVLLDLNIFAPTLAAKLKKLDVAKSLKFIEYNNEHQDLTEILDYYKGNNIILLYNTEMPYVDNYVWNHYCEHELFSSKLRNILFFPINRGPAISQANALHRRPFTFLTRPDDEKHYNFVYYLINWDGPLPDKSQLAPDSFIIYQGHHPDRHGHKADLILPGATFLEEDGSFLDCLGNIVNAKKVINPPHLVRNNVDIVKTMIVNPRHGEHTNHSYMIRPQFAHTYEFETTAYTFNSYCRASKLMNTMESLV